MVPEITPRTLCACHPIALAISSMLAPLGWRSMARIVASLVSLRFAEGPSIFALRLAPTLAARPGVVSGSFLAPPALLRPVFLDLDIRPSLVGDGVSTVTTASPDTGQARGGGGETIKPARAVAWTPTAMLPLP